MAKRKARRGRGRRRGTGSIITARGMGALNDPRSLVGAMAPPAIGVGVATLVGMGIRQFVTPTSDTMAMLVRYAPLVGLGAGLLAALGLNFAVGRPAAYGAAAGALACAGIPMLYELAAPMLAPSAAPTAGLGDTWRDGFGAVVPEYSMRGLAAPGADISLGATVLEPVGAINSSAFGTSPW